MVRILMVRRLTQFDEFPRHQIGHTFDTVADGSPHWSDGYYFTMGDDAGRYVNIGAKRLPAGQRATLQHCSNPDTTRAE